MLDLDDKPILTEVQTLICFVSVIVVVVMVFFTTNLVRVVMWRRKSDHLSSFHVEPNIFSQVRVCNNMTNNPEMLTDRELEEVTTFF